MQRMTTAEATVEGLIAHGLDTIYALPGVHNDHLFDALFKAKDRIRTVHTRHEQGAGYMALGAALATGKPQAYAVVPGPGLLNSATALLTAHGTNAPVLALIGQIAQADIGRGYGHLHEIRDQAGIISRIVDHTARIKSPAEAPALVADAFRAMRTGRPGPAALECAMDMWGKSAPGRRRRPRRRRRGASRSTRTPSLAAAKRLAAAERILIVTGGGAQDAGPEVTELSRHPAGAGVCVPARPRRARRPQPVRGDAAAWAHELWGEADVVLGIGTRLFYGFQQWGVDDKLSIIRVDADPEEPDRFRKATVALVGDAAPILRRLIAALDGHKRASRHDEMVERQAKWRKRMAEARAADRLPRRDPRRAGRGRHPGGGQSPRWASRPASPIRSTSRAPSSRRASRTASAGATPPRSACRTRAATCRWSRSPATAASCSPPPRWRPPMHHRIPLTVVVFNDDAFGNVRRIQEERYGNRLIASDLTNPDFVRFAESFGAAAERARKPQELRAALDRALKRRDQPTLIEVPVGPLPSPWEFIHLPKVRG